MTHRFATIADGPLLAAYNQQLIQDEGHRNSMSVPKLEERMRNWLSTNYTAVLFEQNHETVAYVLYREGPDEIYLRHLFVIRDRRRQGLGRATMEILRSQIWPRHKRLTVEVLVGNPVAVAFWRAVGYQDYSLKMEILPGL
jgi:GNAT superfamily N-acetyltransferase